MNYNVFGFILGKIDKIRSSFGDLACKLTGMHKYVNEDYFPTYMREVEGDIKTLKRFMKYAKFERDNDSLFNFLVNKYNKKYCPCTFFPIFSIDNEIKYLERRLEIDDIIERSDSPFSDFLAK